MALARALYPLQELPQRSSVTPPNLLEVGASLIFFLATGLGGCASVLASFADQWPARMSRTKKCGLPKTNKRPPRKRPLRKVPERQERRLVTPAGAHPGSCSGPAASGGAEAEAASAGQRGKRARDAAAMGEPANEKEEAVLAAGVPKKPRVDLDLHKKHAVCLVLDYSSQYTQLIARRVRENGVYSMLLPGDVTLVRERLLCSAFAPNVAVCSSAPELGHTSSA